MNITATAALNVWLEVPDTAWWLQLAIPTTRTKFLSWNMSVSITISCLHHAWKYPLPDNTLIFWATTVSFPSDPANARIVRQLSKTMHEWDNISFYRVIKLFTSEDLEEVSDNLLHCRGVTALLSQVVHGLDRLLHQLGVIGFKLTWTQNDHIYITRRLVVRLQSFYTRLYSKVSLGKINTDHLSCH